MALRLMLVIGLFVMALQMAGSVLIPRLVAVVVVAGQAP